MKLLLAAIALSFCQAEKRSPAETSYYLGKAVRDAGKIPTDYVAAKAQAEREKKLLVVEFDDKDGAIDETKDRPKLKACGRCRLKTTDPLLNQPGFNQLGGRGIAIVDCRDNCWKGQVISVLPAAYFPNNNLDVMLDLPEGSLTQRMLVWAIRIRPEQPQSTNGTADANLMNHCASHALVQARADHQHHDMQYAAYVTHEVVAESWPWHVNVVEAAIDIIDAWRHSPSHWSAVSGNFSSYGYDMAFNGRKWYACGVVNR